MVYVGMDMHRKRTQVTVLSQDGTQLMNRPRGPSPGQPMDTRRPRSTGHARSAAHPTRHHPGLPRADRRHRPAPAAPEKRDRSPGKARSPRPGPASTPRDRPDHRHDARGRDRRHRPVPLGSQTLRLGRAHPDRSPLRSQGPPRPHLQTWVGVGPLDAGGGGASGKGAAAVYPHLRPDRPAPRQSYRHRGHRSQAPGPLLLRPQTDERGTTLTG
jgi:hypothetical protein